MISNIYKPTWQAQQVLLWRMGHSSAHLSTANPDMRLSCNRHTHSCVNEPVIESNSKDQTAECSVHTVIKQHTIQVNIKQHS